MDPSNSSTETSPLLKTAGNTSSQISPSKGAWLDRKVEAVSSESVVPNLEKYGSYVGDHILSELSGKSLSERTSSAIERRASRMLSEITAANRDKVQQWSHSGLIEKSFESIHGLKWETLAPPEQLWLRESIEQKLMEQTFPLNKASAELLAKQMMATHQSLQEQYSPRTTEYFRNSLGTRSVVFPGEMSQWANGMQAKQEESSTVPMTLSQTGQKLVRNFDFIGQKVSDRLSHSHIEQLQSASFKEQSQQTTDLVITLVKVLDAVERHQDQLPQELAERMQADLVEQLGQLLDHRERLDCSERQDPLGQGQWQKFKTFEVKSAIRLLDTEIARMEETTLERGLSRKQEKQLIRMTASRELFAEQLAQIEQGADQESDLFMYHSTGRKGLKAGSATNYTHHIKKELAALGISKVSSKLKKARSSELSSVQWQTVNRELNVKVAGQNRKVHSELMPASQMRWGEGQVDIFQNHYHGSGVPSSETRELFHAVNLGKSELSCEREGKSVRLFRGLRSATLCAFGIKDKEQRRIASENRAMELVTAAAWQYIEDHPEAISSVKPIPLKLLSTSLLSPDKLRHYLHIHDDELTMQREQVAALKAVEKKLNSGRPLVLHDASGKQHELNVRIEVANTNFGVNSLSLGPLKKLVRSWGESKAVNAEGLPKIVGSVEPFAPIGGWAGAFLEGDASEKDKRVVRELVEQIRDLYDSGDYRSEGDNAYKMVERLQVLAYKIGVISHINCKSGKDRTGEADAYIKRFATEVDASDKVTPARKATASEDQRLTQEFVYGSGNIEWQQMNINLPGYKTQVGKKRLGEFVYHHAHKANFHLGDSAKNRS